MPIEMMPHPQGQAVIGAFWPLEGTANEDAYAKAAHNELAYAGLAEKGQETIQAAQRGVGGASMGATSDSLLESFGRHLGLLGEQAGLHGSQAGNLSGQSQNIFNTKNLLNGIAWDFISMMEKVTMLLLGSPGGQAAIPGAQAMLQAQAQGLAGMTGQGYNMTSSTLGGNIMSGSPMGGMPMSMPPTMPQMGSMGGWGANPGIPGQFQSGLTGPTALSPGGGFTGSPGSLLTGMMESAPVALSHGITAAQDAIDNVHSAASEATTNAQNALSDAFGLDREVIEVSSDETDDVDAATAGGDSPDEAGEPTAQRGGAPLGGGRPMGGDDGPTVSAQEGGDEPEAAPESPEPEPAPEPEPQVEPGAVNTEASSETESTPAPSAPTAPSTLDESPDPSRTFGVSGTLDVDTPLGGFESEGEARTTLTSSAGVMDAPTQTSAGAAPAAPAAPTGGASGGGGMGMMPMGGMGAAGAMGGQQGQQSQQRSSVEVPHDKMDTRSVVDKLASGDIAPVFNIERVENPVGPAPRINGLSPDALDGARTLARVLTAQGDLGVTTHGAVAVYGDRHVYSTPDLFGFTMSEADLPEGNSLLEELVTNPEPGMDAALFLSDWIGNDDPALIIEHAVRCGLIAEPRVIVTNYSANDPSLLPERITLLRGSLLAHVDPSPVVEEPTAHLPGVYERDVLDVLAGSRAEWGVPEYGTHSRHEYRAQLIKRRWSDAQDRSILTASIWTIITEAEHALNQGRVDEATRLALLVVGFPSPSEVGEKSA